MPSFQLKKTKENARLDNSKDKNGNAASTTNATHVNPGPRQQSALDVALAEAGAQCRINHPKGQQRIRVPTQGFCKDRKANRPSNQNEYEHRNRGVWMSFTPNPYAGELQ